MVELMVAITIMAILMTLALPSFSVALATTRLRAATNEFYASLSQARAEAIRSGRRVTVCISSNASQCDAATGGSGGASNWAVGWITFIDPIRASRPSVDAGEAVRFIAQASHSSIMIRGNTMVASYVSFAPDGTSKLMSGAFQAGTLRVCATTPALSDDERARDIIVSSSGRMVISRPKTAVAATCDPP